MRVPIQAPPVNRGLARVHQVASLQQSDCSGCLTQLLGCASSCLPNPLNLGCVLCLGPAAAACIPCVTSFFGHQ